MAYRKIVLTVFLCLVPWTVRAQDTLLVDSSAFWDGRIVPLRDVVKINGYWIWTPDSLRIHPEPWPDSALVAYVKHLVDSSLAQIGHWRVKSDTTGWIYSVTTTGIDTTWPILDTTWVWVKGAKP